MPGNPATFQQLRYRSVHWFSQRSRSRLCASLVRGTPLVVAKPAWPLNARYRRRSCPVASDWYGHRWSTVILMVSLKVEAGVGHFNPVLTGWVMSKQNPCFHHSTHSHKAVTSMHTRVFPGKWPGRYQLRGVYWTQQLPRWSLLRVRRPVCCGRSNSRPKPGYAPGCWNPSGWLFVHQAERPAGGWPQLCF